MAPSNASPSGPRKPRSPWMWVALGCGVSVLLTFGGCVAFLGYVGNRAAQEMRKPLDQKAVLAKLGDTPIYQPSTFNESATKGARIGSSLFPGEMVSAAAFDTSSKPNDIFDWYEQQLTAQGYRRLPEQTFPGSKVTQISFQRQSENIIVQVEEASTDSQKQYTFVLIRVKPPTTKASP